MKKVETVLGVVELLIGAGVTTLVVGALVLVTPAKMGVIKKISVSLATVAISCMASDMVNTYVDKHFKKLAKAIENINVELTKKDETVEVEGA